MLIFFHDIHVTEANTSTVRSHFMKEAIPILYNIETLEESAEFGNKRDFLTNSLILPILSQVVALRPFQLK